MHRDARYELRREIDAGGTATVYEAVDRHRNQVVALKVLHERAHAETLARVEREARTVMALHHPNICRVFDAGVLDDDHAYVAMELLEGESFRSYLGRRGALDFEEGIELVLQVLSALDAAHELGIVHRDVKPENIFLTHERDRGSTVKLLDFGICRRLGMAADYRTLTRTGHVIGTPEYMSPEQVEGCRDVDGRVDLFAVGMILFEALSGVRLHVGLDPAEIFLRILRRPLPSLSTLRPGTPFVIENVVSQAIRRNPNERFASAREFQEELIEARSEIRGRTFHHRRDSVQQRSYAETQPAIDPESLPFNRSGIVPAAEDSWEVPTRATPMPGRHILRRVS